MSRPREDSRALIRYALGATVVTVAVSWGLFLVRDVLLLVYLSAIVAVGLGPIVAALERGRFSGGRRRPRWLVILAVYLVFAALAVAGASMVVPPLATQSGELWRRLPDLLLSSQQWLVRVGLLQHEMTMDEAVRQVPLGGAGGVTAVAGALWGVVGGVFGLVTILMLSAYLLVDADRVVAVFLRLFPAGERPRVAAACQRASRKVSAWLIGQLVLATIIGVTSGVGLYLLGVPYFFVLALIAGVGEMIPIVGPIVSALPAIAVAASTSLPLAAGVAALFFVQQQLENHLLVPKLMEHQVGVSAVMVIVALLLGGSLLGIPGAVIAIPTAAVLQVLFSEIYPDTPE